MSLCFCGRAARGFAWHDFSRTPFDRPPPVQACSMTCLDIATRRKGQMKANIDEQRAITAASPAIGAFLEDLGKSDLAVLTQQEWLAFLTHAYVTVCAEVSKIWENEVPF